jgi:hypothetical protein
MQAQEQTVETVQPQTSTPDVELSQEQQMETVKKTATMRQKALSQLVRVHLADLIQDLAFTPGLSGNEKVKRINTILDSVEGVLDLGLDITNVKVPEKGPYARRTVQFAGVLAQALDNRMLLLASRLDEKERTEHDEGVEIAKGLAENPNNETEGAQ